MIKYVTDTMALVSYIGKRRLPASTKQIFQSADANLVEILIPSVVFFEIHYLFERSRIDVSPNDVLQHLTKYPSFKKQDLTFEIVSKAFAINDIPELHDRLIGGTAHYFDAELITNDPLIQASQFVKTVW